MRVLIENYRGWEIFFDTDKEEFYTLSDYFDKQETRRSYASTKKYIDTYTKNNSEFQPIKVQKMPFSNGCSHIITLIGLRKDNAFMYEDSSGKKQQLSSYYEKDYFVVDSRNEPHFAKISELYSEIDKIREKIAEEEKFIIKVDVKSIRENLI